MRRLLVAASAISVCLAGAPTALAQGRGGTAAGQAVAGVYSEWPVSSAAIAGASVGIVLFLRGFLRLRRRGRRDHASLSQLALFLAAVGVSLLALMSPLDPIGERYLVSAHMLQHLVLFDAVPVLLLVALRRPLLFFVVPAGLLRVVGRGSLRRVIEGLGGKEAALVASVVACGFWQLPAAYDYAVSHPLIHALEHVTLLAGGFLVWRQLLDRDVDSHRGARSSMVWCTAFCAAGFVSGGMLLLSHAELYGAYAAQPERLFGVAPLLDQRLAGLIMLCMQFVMLGVGLHLAGAREAIPRAEPLAEPATG